MVNMEYGKKVELKEGKVCFKPVPKHDVAKNVGLKGAGLR